MSVPYSTNLLAVDKMETIFNPISNIIGKYSYGACIAIVRQISYNLRLCRIDPYKYYILNYNGSVIVLLPLSQRIDSHHNGIIFRANSKEYCTTWTMETCEKILHEATQYSPPCRIVLFRDLKHHKIVDIINQLIHMNIFQIKE